MPNSFYLYSGFENPLKYSIILNQVQSLDMCIPNQNYEAQI